MDFILNTLAVSFMISHVSLGLLSITCLNWPIVKSKGVTLDLMLFAGYRHKRNEAFVLQRYRKMMVTLDQIRIISLLGSISLWFIGLLLNMLELALS